MAGIEDWLGLDGEALARLPQLARFAVPPATPIGDRSYIAIRPAGLSFVLADHRTVDTIQIHAGGHEGHTAYAGPLPAGLRFAMGRPAVRALLGEREAQGEKATLPLLGEKPAWDRFAWRGRLLHVEYAPDEMTIQMISIF